MNDSVAAIQAAWERSTQDEWKGCHDGDCQCGCIYAKEQDFIIARTNLNHEPDAGVTVKHETYTANSKFIFTAHNHWPDVMAYIRQLEAAAAGKGKVGYMQQRTSRRNFEFQPIHTKEKNVILEFTRRCIRLFDDAQPIRATADEIAGLVSARDELQKCNNPIMHYGAQVVYKEWDMPTHLDLLLELNNLIIELKLRNLEHETREITMDEIERIRDLTFKLDGCRKRAVFY